jgi:hypothetical protein
MVGNLIEDWIMVNWQEGLYNSDYILHHRSIVGQLKYESKQDPARLDEISIEKHLNGDMCILFTTHPDATNDTKQGSIHARLAYNSLFQDLQRLISRTGLEYVTTNLEEVHCVRGRKGQERSLIQALILLEEYDNSLAEISKILRNYIAPERASLEDLTDEIMLQKQRLHLLEQVLAVESGGKQRRASRTGKFKQKTIAKRRAKVEVRRRKRA